MARETLSRSIATALTRLTGDKFVAISNDFAFIKTGYKGKFVSFQQME